MVSPTNIRTVRVATTLCGPLDPPPPEAPPAFVLPLPLPLPLPDDDDDDEPELLALLAADARASPA